MLTSIRPYLPRRYKQGVCVSPNAPCLLRVACVPVLSYRPKKTTQCWQPSRVFEGSYVLYNAPPEVGTVLRESIDGVVATGAGCVPNNG